MARPASQDPVEKFRFQVVALTNGAFHTGNAINNSTSGNNVPNTIANNAINSQAFNATVSTPHTFSRAGFMEVAIPKVNISEMLYRENTDGAYFRKIAGLNKFEPVTLRRGVTSDDELFDWYTLVNNDAGTLNAVSVALTAFGAVPYQQPKYRKDILISSMDRTGAFVKHWALFDAWPISYKGGDGLDSSSETKLIEELILTYETFLEVTGSSIDEALINIQQLITEAGLDSLVGAVAGTGAGALSKLF